MLSISKLIEQRNSSSTITDRRSSFYESASLSVFEKVISQDYTEYQLKNFINSRTSGEGFKEAVKGGLEKIWKFIKGIFNAILKGLDNFWQTIRKIFSRKKNKDETKEKTNDELNAAVKEKERLAKELERTKEQLRQAQQSNKTNANLKNQNAEKIDELERLQKRNEKKIFILKNKLTMKNAELKSTKMDLDLRSAELEKAEKNLKEEKQLSSFTRKSYDNYRDKTEEKYGIKEIKKFLYNMRDIGGLISDSTDHLANLTKYVTKISGDHSSTIHTSMEAFKSEMLEVQRKLDDINVDKVKGILSKGFYLTQEELEFGTSLPRDAFSHPYDILRKSQSRLTRLWKKLEKAMSQSVSNEFDEEKAKIELMEVLAEGLKQVKTHYDKFKRHLVSFAIAIEPILDEKAKGYFRGIR
nr:MAG TPA: hypothetical protein [Caudoviricetes sp.]